MLGVASAILNSASKKLWGAGKDDKSPTSVLDAEALEVLSVMHPSCLQREGTREGGLTICISRLDRMTTQSRMYRRTTGCISETGEFASILALRRRIKPSSHASWLNFMLSRHMDR